MKGNNEEKRRKIKSREGKLNEKSERLLEIEKENEKKRKGLIKKLLKKEKNKDLADKQKHDYLLSLSKEREHLRELYSENKFKIEEEDSNKRSQILNMESIKMAKIYSSYLGDKFRQLNSQNETIMKQIEEDKKAKTFVKDMNNLISNNIMKLNNKQKKQIYLDKLRKEREQKRKEEEAKLEKMGLI